MPKVRCGVCERDHMENAPACARAKKGQKQGEWPDCLGRSKRIWSGNQGGIASVRGRATRQSRQIVDHEIS